MSGEQAGLDLVVLGATYPIELLSDADALATQAAEERSANPPDHRDIPPPLERAHARAAIFTAFNFLESLLIELAQEHIQSGQASSGAATTIAQDLKNRKGISATYRSWPLALFNKDSSAEAEFTHFEDIRELRNQLVHPKLVPSLGARSQDDLLKIVTADRASRVIAEVSKMASVWFTWFGKSVPPEVATKATRPGL
jgi:hypothetical protein